MTNQEIAEVLQSMAAAAALDPHGGVRRYIVNQLLKHGIIDSMPESLLDPYRECPLNWTALQIAYFDNGEPTLRRKREKLPRTKMRFGGNIKAWTREQINFGNGKQVAWTANFYCWDAVQALAIVQDLRSEKLIDTDTVTLMQQVVGDPTAVDPSWRFSIPLLKTTGTRWMSKHLVLTILDRNGVPEQSILLFPDQRVSTSEPMSDRLPNGNKFAGSTILQARLAKSQTMSSWATEVL